MAYGNLNVDVVQSSTAGTPPQFNDGNGTQVGTLCRAWVNFNGTSGASPVVRASFNVGSVTRTATGSYTINFTNALSDTNYSVVISAGQDSVVLFMRPLTYVTTSVSMYTWNGSQTLTDATLCNVAIFR